MTNTTTKTSTKTEQFHMRVSQDELQEWERMAKEYSFKTLASLVRASLAMFDKENSRLH